MGGENKGVNIDFSGAAFVSGVFLLIVLFWGEPDLHDGILFRLMGPNATGSNVLIEE